MSKVLFLKASEPFDNPLVVWKKSTVNGRGKQIAAAIEHQFPFFYTLPSIQLTDHQDFEKDMKVEQIRSTDGTGTLSYFVSDEAAGVSCFIDPNMDDLKVLKEILHRSRTRLTHIFDTHTHADHISGAGELQKQYGAKIVMHENTKNKWKVVDQGDKFGIGETLRANAGIPIDLYVNDNGEILVGSMTVKTLFTPGHTDNHLTLHIDDNIFTGDLLLIGQAGRSDLPGGNPEDQYESLMNKILPLPDATRMYPGHDYENNTFSMLDDEKRNNPFLQERSKEEYLRFVQEFFPPLAEMSSSGGKVTLQCGVQRVAQSGDTFKNISALELNELMKQHPGVILLDVREPFELATTGAIKGVENISVRELKDRSGDLPQDRSRAIVAICASGARSGEAAHLLQQLGYTNVMNLTGGTIGWINNGLPVVRPSVRVKG